MLGEIFDYLRNAHFINDNSNDEAVRAMFDYLDNPKNFETAKIYFKPLNLILEKGNGYFYFSKISSLQSVESKIDTAYKWIDILDFFRTYNPAFGVGTTFRPSEIRVACINKNPLKTKLNRAKKGNATPIDKIKYLADELVKADFAILQPDGEQYKVLSAIDYLDRLINLIYIQDDETTT